MKSRSFFNKLLEFDDLAGLKFIPGSSWIQELHPLVKVGFLLAFASLVLISAEAARGAVLLGILLMGYISSGLGLGYWLRKLRFILFFAAFILLIQILFRQQGAPLWQFRLGPWQFGIWSEGLGQGLALAMRFLNLIGLSFLFVATTDPMKLVQGLIQAGLPYRWGFMLITALRFIPGYQDDFRQIRLAVRLKGVRYDGFSWTRLMNMLRYLLVPLLATTIHRVDTLSMSMDGRAFGLYPKRTFLTPLLFTRKDAVIALLGILVVILFLLSFYFG